MDKVDGRLLQPKHDRQTFCFMLGRFHLVPNGVEGPSGRFITCIFRHSSQRFQRYWLKKVGNFGVRVGYLRADSALLVTETNDDAIILKKLGIKEIVDRLGWELKRKNLDGISRRVERFKREGSQTEFSDTSTHPEFFRWLWNTPPVDQSFFHP